MRAVLGAGFLLLVSLAISTAIAALVDLAANIERSRRSWVSST